MSPSQTSSLLSSVETYVTSLRLDETEKEKFLADLANASSEKVLDAVMAIQNSYMARPKLQSVAEKMGKCMTRLERLFQTIDIAIQADPTVSAIVWAGLRLLFQLAADFSSFFDKLAMMIERMVLALPDYGEYMSLFKEDDQLKASIVDVYQDLMDFLRIATEPRRVVKIAMTITWTPFDQRFGDILKRFNDHHEKVKSRVLFSSMVNTKRAQDDAELERQRSNQDREMLTRLDITTKSLLLVQQEERKEAAFRRLLDWLNPKSCQDLIDHICESRHPKTGFWIVQSTEYLEFTCCSHEEAFTEGKILDDSLLLRSMDGNSTMNKSNQRVQEITERKPNNNLLWIYGNPGCGKTWLTTLLIEDLLSRKDLIFLQQQPTIVHYFCSYTENTKTADILRSILAQLLHAHRDNHEVVDAYCFCYSKSITSMATSNSQLMQLLEITLRHLHNVFIVIDGLDECQDRDQIAPFLLRLSLQPSLVKVLILARDSDTILRRKLTLFKGLEITNSLNRPDILAYASSRIEDLVDCTGFNDAEFHKDDLALKFTTASNGMFFIGFPEGLETLYARIFQILSLRPKPERRLAAQILTWTCWSHEPLTLDELEAALKFQNGVDFSFIARVSCAGIIEITQDSKVQFIHLSAKEFIETCESYLNRGIINLVGLFHQPSAGQNHLALNCLQYLSDQVPGEPLSGQLHRPIEKRVVQEKYPLLRYATLNWISHLDAKSFVSNPSGSDCDRQIVTYVQGFVTSRNRILLWAEAQYTFGAPLLWDSFHRLLSWADAATTHILKAKDEDLVGFTKMFIRDFQDLQLNFDQELNAHPHKVWTGMTDWSSVGGPLKSSRSTIIICEQEAPEQLDGTGSSTPWDTDSPVAVISELSTDCKNLLVCSVWASRDFSSLLQIERKTTAGRFSLPSCLDFKKVASGWILRLETWDLISRKKTAFPKDLPLNPVEVENQLRKSFCYDAFRKPRFGFPMALSPNHDLIAVLGTIYRIETNQIPSKSVKWWVKSLETQETGSACYHDYRIKFSPCSEFVAYHIARRYREPPHLDGGETLEVFGLAQGSTSKPIWRRDIPCFSNSSLIREDIPDYESVSSSLIVAFHPTLTLIAWSGPMMGTYVSDFTHEKIGLGINLSHQAIGELRFSNCGRLLFGKEDYKHLGHPVCFLVTEAGIPPINPDAIEVTRLGDSVSTEWDLSMVPQQLLNVPMQPIPTQELRVGSFLSSRPNGSPSRSVTALKKSANGQINVQQISNQRGMEERQIASLPASVLTSSSETRVVQHINPEDGSSDELKIVLNKIGNSWYTQSTRESGLSRDPILYIRPLAEIGPWESVGSNTHTNRGSKRKLKDFQGSSRIDEFPEI
ncbi:hypothetical protein N7490_005359 [Penicillium lividum]|nr:hypothetical protein N7490_005359 [Penicillium lividum]